MNALTKWRQKKFKGSRKLVKEQREIIAEPWGVTERAIQSYELGQRTPSKPVQLIISRGTNKAVPVDTWKAET
jgi:hypothetical protein